MSLNVVLHGRSEQGRKAAARGPDYSETRDWRYRRTSLDLAASLDGSGRLLKIVMRSPRT